MYLLKIYYLDSKVVRRYHFDNLFRLCRFIFHIFIKNNRVDRIEVIKEL